jgi:hypothetical protein
VSSDPSIRIPITTEADPAGVDEISAKLDELHEKAAGAAGKPMALAPEMLDPAAIKEVTQEIKEQGAAVAGTAGRYRELEESVREAAEEQARADVERAKAMRSQREQDDQLRQISANTRNMLLVEGIQQMNLIAQGLRGTSAAADGLASGMGVLTAGTTAFIASGGNPLVGVLVGIAAGLKDAINLWGAYTREMKLVDAAHQRAASAMQQLADSRRRLAQQIRAESLDKTFAEEARQAQYLANEMARDHSLENARRAAESRSAAASESAAVVSGAAPGQFRSAAIFRELNGEFASLQQRLEELSFAADAAETELNKAQRELDLKPFRGKDVTAADEENIENLREAADEARRNFAAAAAEAQIQAAAALDEGSAKLSEASTATQADVTRMAEDFAQRIQSDISAAAGAATVAQQTALASVQQLLADATIQPEDVSQLVTAVNQMRNARSEADRQVAADFESMIGLANTLLGLSRNHQAQIADLQRQASALGATRF